MTSKRSHRQLIKSTLKFYMMTRFDDIRHSKASYKSKGFKERNELVDLLTSLASTIFFQKMGKKFFYVTTSNRLGAKPLKRVVRHKHIKL